MGGYLFVGLRSSSGQEYLMKTHTNFWPWKCGDLSFLQEGTAFQELIELSERTKHPKDVFYPVTKQSTIRNTEYGLLLIDFKDRVVFSSNGYFMPGVDCLYDIDVDAAEWVLGLHNNGCLVGVYKGFTTTSPYTAAKLGLPADPVAVQELLNTCNEVITTGTTVHVDLTAVRFNMLDMTVEHTVGPSKDSRSVKKFLEKHSWQSSYGSRKQ